MECHLMWIITIFGLFAIGGAFWRMKPGIGPNNMRVIGLILIITIASLLALNNEQTMQATLGILGAVAGYLFGSASGDEKSENRVNVDGSNVSGNAKIAGRDINETISNIQSAVQEIKDSVVNQHGLLDDGKMDYLVIVAKNKNWHIYEKEMLVRIKGFIKQGWRPYSISSDYKGIEGGVVLFVRKGLGELYFSDGDSQERLVE